MIKLYKTHLLAEQSGMYEIEYCLAEDLQKLWDFCDKEQKSLLESMVEFDIDGDEIDNKYCQGMVIAYRKIQYEINGKCSKFEELDEEIK